MTRYIKRSTILVFVCLAIAFCLEARPRTGSLAEVRYFIHFVADDQITGRTALDFSVCLAGRCSPYTLGPAAMSCGPNELCEMVEIEEKKLQGDGYYYYVRNWLFSAAAARVPGPHAVIRENNRPLDFSTVKNQADARRRVVDRIRDLLLCHDQSKAHKLIDTGAPDSELPPNCDCK